MKHFITACFFDILFLLLVLSALLLANGCSLTQIENRYVVEGSHNSFKVADTVSATPTNKDIVDLAGSAYGDADLGGGKK